MDGSACNCNKPHQRNAASLCYIAPTRGRVQISAYPTSVAALAFSRDGHTLAVASSYTYEQGDQPHAPDAIYLRPMSDAETRPKKPRAV